MPPVRLGIVTIKGPLVVQLDRQGLARQRPQGRLAHRRQEPFRVLDRQRLHRAKPELIRCLKRHLARELYPAS